MNTVYSFDLVLSCIRLKMRLVIGLGKLGFDEIKENQRQVVEAYLAGRDVLMVSQTRSGKSLALKRAE